MCTPELNCQGKKLEGLRKTLQQHYEKNVPTMTIKVPRFSLKDENDLCTFYGVPCKIVAKNTCCVRVEIPVKELHDALTTINL